MSRPTQEGPTHYSNLFCSKSRTYAQLLFVDYSSAFNTVLPRRLFHKMSNLGLHYNICLRIRDFLTNRPQSVRMGPHHSSSLCVEKVATFKFLGTYFSEDLTWTQNTHCLISKAQQQLYFLRAVRKLNLPQQLLLSFYHCSVESVLTYGILVWYGSSSAADKKALQRAIKAAQKITKTHLPTLEDIFNSCCLQKATDILQDPSHLAHHLFELLPSGRRYRAVKTRTRLLNSFYSKAITTLNTSLKTQTHT